MQEKCGSGALLAGQCLSGDDRGADGCDGRARGIRESAEGAAKNFEAYTPAQIEKELKEIFSEVSKGLIDKLRTL